MFLASWQRFAGSAPHRRRRTAIGLSALLFAILPAWLPSHATAQTMPAEISNAPRNIRFIVMRATPGGHCAAGILKQNQSNKAPAPPSCRLSINECLGIAGASIIHNFRGNWSCIPPKSTSTARR
jgi:hypothetical protein